MKKSKVLLCLLVSMLVMACVTGCIGQKTETVIRSDGTCSYKYTYLYDKSMFDKLESSGGMDDSARELSSGDYLKEVVDIKGIPYYSFSRNFEFSNLNELKAFLTEDETYFRKITSESKAASQYDKSSHTAPYSSVTLDTGTFIGVLKDSILDESLQKDSGSDKTTKSKETTDVTDTDLKGNKSIGEMCEKLGIVVEVSITLPSAVTGSNGKIQGNTVTWSINDLPDDGKLIAVTGNNPILSSDKTPPVIKGVKNKGLYNKTVKITAQDNVSLKELRLNGARYNTSAFRVGQSGSYTLTAEDASHNKTTVRFKIDKKKPVVKGAKNGKRYRKNVTLRFSDTNGIRSVKINGKKKSTKKTVLKKNGKYTVKATDKAGNTSTVRFWINK
ncbi:MAG: hypothetical protein HFG34_06450 [Eubacterium sp.]|nr:hypothetical protein [Eubacterium sp.]